MFLLLSFTGIIIISYSTIMFILARSWRNASIYEVAEQQPRTDKLISVVVAVRNEEDAILSLLDALLEQTLPTTNFEVIIVDDNSTDNTFSIVHKLSKKHSWLRTLKQDSKVFGKKRAIELGVKHSNCELIAFTDADCHPGPNWLNTLWGFYVSQNKPDFIIGLVDLITRSWKQELFRMEFISLVLVSASAAVRKSPVFCNGANMAVKKKILDNYRLDDKITSGDDVFLLHHVKKHHGTISVLKSPLHLVKSNAPINFSDFWQQRKRWASKARFYKDRSTILLAIMIFLANSILLAALITSILYGGIIPATLFFVLKCIGDTMIFLSDKRLYKNNRIILWLPVIEIFYMLYIFAAALISQKSPFEWKGRKYIR